MIPQHSNNIKQVKTIHKRTETYHELSPVLHVYLYDTSSDIQTSRMQNFNKFCSCMWGTLLS